MEPISKPSQELPSIPLTPTQEDHLHPVPKLVATERRARRRTREVSSRYLSPTPPNSRSFTPIPYSPSLFPSSEDLPLPHLKKHHQREKHPQDFEPSSDAGDIETEHASCFADENRPAAEAKQILMTPLPLGIHIKAVGTERKRVVRLFGENGAEEQQPRSRKTRPGTPMINAGDRVSLSNNCTPKLSSLKRIVAQGSKLPGLVTLARASPFPLEEDSSSRSLKTSLENTSTDSSEAEFCDASDHGEFCKNPPLLCQKNSAKRAGSDRLLKKSVRQLPESGGLGRHDTLEDSCRRMSSSFCHRSLNLPLSNCQQPPYNPTKSVCRPLVVSLKSQISTARSVALGLPPQPPSTKPRIDLKMGNNSLNRQEDIHALRLLNNCYLQWRFINAKAHAAVHAQIISAKKSLHSHEIKLSELRDSVAVKRIQLEQVKGARKLQAIVEDQMPYLDQWTAAEGDHSSSFTGAVKALQDASLRLPVIGDVKADIGELDEVLRSALDMMEESSSCVGRFLLQAEKVDDVISDLASIVSRERALFEECRDLIFMAHELQVKECSLRSQLIQQKQNCVK